LDLEVTGPIFIEDTFVRTVGSLTADAKQATLAVTQWIDNQTASVQQIHVRARLEPSNFDGPPVVVNQRVTL
jgi:hypothetical protein